MTRQSVEAEIAGIEAQLRIVKALNSTRKRAPRATNLRGLKGVLRGKGRFTDEDIVAVRAKIREDL